MNTNENKTEKVNDSHLMNDAQLMVEAQIANHIVDLLDHRVQQLTPVEVQRLSAARSLAVSQLTSLQTQAASHHGVNQSGHVLQWFGHHVGQHKIMSSALLVVAMLLALFVAQQFSFTHNLENSDAFLLASDLPPEAYADKGFNAWLDSN
ncbi:MAG: DUF3619 family protein [Methylotenera sp.]|nr:DUF3619 family protein [Methylotenera sp.]MDD4924977.1 DUF3619 family protein [Methylotenera sp.]NOS96236.1 DUF3619 family protein [Methylotenera sp.]NOU41168.1 DUF3619 family protein [Methylotenera sp.]